MVIPLVGGYAPQPTDVGGYTPVVGGYTPTFTLDADFYGDYESGLRCGCSQPTFSSNSTIMLVFVP